MYGKKAGLKRCYAHKLRHTSAVMYLRNGGDVFSIQQILGHTTLEMVRRYVSLAPAHVTVQHRKFSPMDRLNLTRVEISKPRKKPKRARAMAIYY
jgi:site-specific recombinase XerD